MRTFIAILLAFTLTIHISCSGGGGDTQNGGTTAGDNGGTKDITDTSDFTLPTGADTSVGQGEGPWNRRLRVAISTDGMTWTRTGVTIADQADVPSLIVVDGKLWVFFVLWSDADKSSGLFNTTVAAYSSDLVEWTYKKLNFNGTFPENRTTNPVDPSIVQTSDGSYRIYYTLGGTSGAKAASFSAISTDLVNWTLEEGAAYSIDGENTLDPNLLWVGGHYEFFAGGIPRANHHATSTDGRTFTPLVHFATSDPFIVMANGAKLGDKYVYYGFSQEKGSQTKDIRSLTYAGGSSWTVDDGVRLAVDETDGMEKGYVADPSVEVHPAGSANGYVMVYSTGIP